MRSAAFNPTPLLLIFGLVAFGLAALSVADMYVQRPYDGVVPVNKSGRVMVDEVVAGSSADRAGLRSGDEIVGIGRQVLGDAQQAARVLNQFQADESVVYLIKRDSGLKELTLRLGQRRIGDGTYLYSVFLGLSFFLMGLFVLIRRPLLRASQVFFLLCNLFLLVLVCRMRLASYSGIDTILLHTGTLALLLLPPAFLHFYLLFPRPAWLQDAERRPVWRSLARLWIRGWLAIYLLPLLVYVGVLVLARMRGEPPRLINGAPAASWWLLAVFLLCGLLALRANGQLLESPRERRGMALVLFGSFFGLMPFLVSTIALGTFQQSRTSFLVGILPVALVPLTFTYAIVRFQLLDIRVMLRRSLLYTLSTALLTGLYAGGIVTFNAFFRGTALDRPGYFSVFLALAIVLLFDPLRRRVQTLLDRSFFAGRARLSKAMVALGEAMTAQVDLQEVVRELVEELPRLLGVRFAALYLLRGYRLQRIAGPPTLPKHLPVISDLQRFLQRRERLTRLDQLGTLTLRSQEVAQMVSSLSLEGVEVLADLTSRRRHLGMVLLSDKEGQIPLERDELDLLRQLLQQAGLALETSMLLEERTQRAELEREMEIAATIQEQLLPAEMHFGPGWEISALCRPARIVGGDFFAQLPTQCSDRQAVIFGDVCGKSVSGALMMMAAHESLHALALTCTDPAELFTLANRRLYSLGKRNFVAMGYLAPGPSSGALHYLVAGQPALLRRRRDGSVEELPLGEHRIPIGALKTSDYRALETVIEPGEAVIGYSDGVIDAQSSQRELFGEERLRQVIAASSGDPRQLIDDIMQAVDDFCRGSLQYDDMTLTTIGRPLESS